ncbi:MAG TPA: hypothetical protein VHD87_00635 [Acidimicrobiales bacterium]|nr:hypothetical protein [Acidimicrobiales bacterium]
MGAAVGIDDHGTLRVDRGGFDKPDAWARQLIEWLGQLLAADFELFQLRTSPLASDQFAVAAVKQRVVDTTTIRVGTGRGEDAVAAVTKAVTTAVCDDGDLLERALDRLVQRGEVDAAALCGENGECKAHADPRLCGLLAAFDEPGFLELRTDNGEYAALRLGDAGIALAVGMRSPSPRVRDWLRVVWEGVGEPASQLDPKDGHS